MLCLRTHACALYHPICTFRLLQISRALCIKGMLKLYQLLNDAERCSLFLSVLSFYQMALETSKAADNRS